MTIDTNQQGKRSVWSYFKESLNSEHQDFTTGSIRKAIFLLAIPMILEMCMESVFAVVDIFFVGKLGPHAAATVGLTESFLTIVYSVAIGLSMATTISKDLKSNRRNFPTRVLIYCADWLQNGMKHFALCGHSILAHAVSVELQRSPDIRVAEQWLHCLRVGLASHRTELKIILPQGCKRRRFVCAVSNGQPAYFKQALNCGR